MLRVFLRGALRSQACLSSIPNFFVPKPNLLQPLSRQFHVLTIPKLPYPVQVAPKLLEHPTVALIAADLSRPLTKFSLRKGKRKTVKAVIKRFYRLDWGGWIRTIAGRHKRVWKKSAARKRRVRQHVLVNSTQSWLLDSMVTNFWRKPKYYVDDPYEPYHQREEFWITRRKPM